MSASRLRLGAAGVVFLGVGFLAGRWATVRGEDSPVVGEEEQGVVTDVRFTSPFLETAGRRDADPGLALARTRIAAYVDELKAQDGTLEVGVYARDLLNGPWIGVNERETFQPASLMKVSVLIYTLHRMSREPELRERMVVYPGPAAMPSPDNLAVEAPERRMTPGGAYSMEDLLWRMIGWSDNHAKDLLLQDVEPGDVDRFLAGYGVPVRVEGEDAVMDARSYAVLFRLLFNASVLSRQDSEWALELLSRAEFPGGMRSVTPTGMPVASKWGRFFSSSDLSAGVQLHECGILYFPSRPTVLCIMTSSVFQGERLDEIIRQITSEIVAAQSS